MSQRISVRIQVISESKTLIIRRADGRESIKGRYELPGGRVNEGEQPEDSAKRLLKDQVGIQDVSLKLADVMTYQDTYLSTQYAVIIFKVTVGDKRRVVELSPHYDKYIWYQFGKVDSSAMTDVSQLILGAGFDQSGADNRQIKAENRVDAVVYTDGGSRGNPGPSAGGYIIVKNGEIIDQGGEYIGITTNNQAEYHGVKLGLEAALSHNLDIVEIRIDSMLVVNQLNGLYKIKNRELWPINDRVQELIGQFKRVKFVFVPREQNQLADGMVNRTLNAQEVM